MRVRKKIQNRESARRVRLREKDGACTLQYRFIELQERAQRLHIENTGLRSENSMFKNQVEFMEKLLLQRGVCTNEYGSTNEFTGNTRRVATVGGPFSKNIGMVALVCTILVTTYIPESASNSAVKASVQQRILAEITTGFHLFSLQSPSNYFLSIFRITAFSLVLFYLFCTVISGVKRVTKPSSEEILQEFLDKKNN